MAGMFEVAGKPMAHPDAITCAIASVDGSKLITGGQDKAVRVWNLGDDADTTAAIVGQIAGAWYGLDGIPAHWRARLHRGAEIETMARRLGAA